LKCYLLTKKPIFKDAWIHHHILDEVGKKMSKSVGNVIDPHKILEKFGAEPFRLWCALEGNLEKDDMRCSFERIEGAGKMLAKLWNVSKFVGQFSLEILKIVEKTGEEVEVHELDAGLLDINLTELDKWIIHELNKIVEHTRNQYEKYDFHNPAIEIRHFLWETFASNYLELAKNRAYNHENKFTKEEQKSAVFTLHYCMSNMLKLLAPVIPFITHVIYKELYMEDVHGEAFPKHIMMEDARISEEDITGLNSVIWKKKREGGLSLKSGISELTVPEKFKCIEKDIVATHSVKNMKYGNSMEVKI
jgi:valyl-tRNA synthetase